MSNEVLKDETIVSEDWNMDSFPTPVETEVKATETQTDIPPLAQSLREDIIETVKRLDSHGETIQEAWTKVTGKIEPSQFYKFRHHFFPERFKTPKPLGFTKRERRGPKETGRLALEATRLVENEGITPRDACRRLQLSFSSYYQHLKRNERKPKKARFIDLDSQDESIEKPKEKIFEFRGTRDQLILYCKTVVELTNAE